MVVLMNIRTLGAGFSEGYGVSVGAHRARPAGSYGWDAAWVPIFWLVCGAACLIGAVFSASADPPWNIIAVLYLTLLGLLFIAGGLVYLRATLRGKFEVWAETLDALGLRGDEDALDLGCGRGAVAIMLAERMPGGHVTGIDLWHSRDQSGNSIANAQANLAANGVADRVELVTGDMTALPFADASFDVVTASMAIHNIHAAGGREAALREALRVLRIGGRLVIVDISATKQYVRILGELTGESVSRVPLGWRMWWTGPWMSTALVSTTRTR